MGGSEARKGFMIEMGKRGKNNLGQKSTDI